MAPFGDAKALYQAVLEEMKSLVIDPRAEIDTNFYKNLFCVGLSSKKIESFVWLCAARCLYNGVKVTPDIFEPEEARSDYFQLCWEVAEENIRPFTKNLFAELSRVMHLIENFQK